MSDIEGAVRRFYVRPDKLIRKGGNCDCQSPCIEVVLGSEFDQAVNALRAAEQCVGELPPTQARVETMHMIQAVLRRVIP